MTGEQHEGDPVPAPTPGSHPERREQKRALLKSHIIKLAEEQVMQNRPLSIKTLVPQLVERVPHASDQEIREAFFTLFREHRYVRATRLFESLVAELVQEKRLLEGRRILPSLVLKNPRRRKIYEYIRAHPATFFKDLQGAFGYGVASLYSHLRYLEEFDHLRVTRFQKRKYYFVADHPPARDLACILRRTPPYLELLEVLAREKDLDANRDANRDPGGGEGPGARECGSQRVDSMPDQKATWSLTGITRQLHKHVTTVREQLATLVEHEIVHTVETPRGKHYYLSPEIRRYLASPGRAGQAGLKPY